MTTMTNNFLSIDTLQAKVPAIFAEHPHERVSNKFNFVSTAEIIQAMAYAGWYPVAAKQVNSRKQGRQGFAKHLVRFRSNAMPDITVGDIIPEIVVRNAHDGTSAYVMERGLFRLACLNGLVVGDTSLGTLRVRHSGNDLDNVIEGVYEVVEDFPKVADKVNEFRSIQVPNLDMRRVYAESAAMLRWQQDDAPIIPDQLLQPRRQADTGNGLWEIYQRVQENIINGGVPIIPGLAEQHRGVTIDHDNRPKRQAKATRPVKSIDADVRINKALWNLTEKMADLLQ